MTLHPPTLVLALILGFALLTLELGVAQRRLRERPEVRRWTQGSLAILLGLVTVLARPVIPAGGAIVLGNALIALGMALYCDALHLLLRQAAGPRWVLQLAAVFALALVPMVDWPVPQRSAVVSAVFALLLLPSVVVTVRDGWAAERSLRTVAVTLGLAASVMLVRAVHALASPQDYQDLLQPSLGQGLTFLVAFTALTGAGFGFVLTVAERVTRQMEVLATHDGLTGCQNRTTTDALLQHALRRARREGRPLTFVLLDLDHFKQVNDHHGHRTGDEVLKRFADTVRQRLRASDVFGRTGGEEFGLVLPDTDASGAQVLVESIRQAVAAMTVTDDHGQPVRVTVSAGIATVGGGDAEVRADRLYGRADQSLYEAKRAGRNRVEVYGLGTAQASLLPDG